MIKLRRFMVWDIPFVLRLMKQKSVKQWSRSRQFLDLKQHIEDIVSKKFIIMHKGRKAGMIRLYQGEVSIAVSEDSRQRGVAISALKQLCSKEQSLWASVNKENRVSQRLFMRAGFLFDYDTAEDIIYKWK